MDYELRVPQEQISSLAEGCGFKHRDVAEILQVDNTKRIEPRDILREIEDDVSDTTHLL